MSERAYLSRYSLQFASQLWKTAQKTGARPLRELLQLSNAPQFRLIMTLIN